MQCKINEEAKDLVGNIKRYCEEHKINENQVDIDYIEDQIANVKRLIKKLIEIQKQY